MKSATELDSLGKVLDHKKDTITDYQTIQKTLDKRIDSADRNLFALSEKIKIINNKSIVNQDLYLVDKIEYKCEYENKSDKDRPDTCRYYYSKLKSIKGEDLPIFDKAPFLALVPETPVQLIIFETTKDYFIILNTGNSFNFGDYWDKIYFGIMVSQR